MPDADPANEREIADPEFSPEDCIVFIDEDGQPCSATGKPVQYYAFSHNVTIPEIEAVLAYLKRPRRD